MSQTITQRGLQSTLKALNMSLINLLAFDFRAKHENVVTSTLKSNSRRRNEPGLKYRFLSTRRKITIVNKTTQLILT